MLSQLCLRIYTSFIVNVVIVAAIVLLCLLGCPDTIRFRIRTIIVHTFNRKFWAGAWPEVCIKSLKRFPLYCNTSATISWIRFVSGIMTTCFNINKDSIFSDVAHLMCCIRRYCLFPMQTATTFCSFLLQTCRIHNAVSTTNTFAMPPCTPFRAVRGSPNNSQSRKSVSGKIKNGAHSVQPPFVEKGSVRYGECGTSTDTGSSAGVQAAQATTKV